MDEYIYVQCEFPNYSSDRGYTFHVCDGLTVVPGDHVIVITRNGEKEAKVTAVGVSKPPYRTKPVVRRI